MKKYVLFDVAQGTQNLGDYIIMKCIMEEMNYLFHNEFLVHFSTHTPIARFYQNFRRNMMSRACDSADNKFICGANTIKNSLFRLSPDWNINIFNCKYYKNSICIGVGMDMNSKRMDLYTKFMYSKIFHKNYIHSVRDERTKKVFESMGLKVINTGCPTIWSLTSEFCLTIPTKKSRDVIFTLTDYHKDSEQDQKLIDILQNNYEKVYYWIQGSEDYEYFQSLKNIDSIIIVGPSLEEYEKILESNDIDYVGTRLHAGIYAMRYRKRSIIISVDNRAEDMAQTYNLNTLKRENISQLSKKIHSVFKTEVNINTELIEEWKSQFRKDVNS